MSTKRAIQYWVIPPEANGEFVACMEDVLEIYFRPYDPTVPVLCMDGQPVQLAKETTAWHDHVNNTQRGIERQMKVDDARLKLTSVYPKIKVSLSTRLQRPATPTF